MGYIPSADTVYAIAYLTDIGRTYLFNKNNTRFDSVGDDLFQIKNFTLSDADTNYQTAQLLGTGEVPDITGKSEGCLKTAANYVQSNLISFIFETTEPSPSTSIQYKANNNQSGYNLVVTVESFNVGTETQPQQPPK